MDTVHECDRQTDGQTDRITITDTVQTASHGKNDVRTAIQQSYTPKKTYTPQNKFLATPVKLKWQYHIKDDAVTLKN